MKNSEDYSDMIGLPHHTSKKHPPMSREARAAQFSPFAALKGYDEELGETARLTHARILLDEESKAAINEKLLLLKEREREHPCVRVTYFLPDEHKAGGEYVTEEGELRRIDAPQRKLLLASSEISFADIFTIEIL